MQESVDEEQPQIEESLTAAAQEAVATLRDVISCKTTADLSRRVEAAKVLLDAWAKAEERKGQDSWNRRARLYGKPTATVSRIEDIPLSVEVESGRLDEEPDRIRHVLIGWAECGPISACSYPKVIAWEQPRRIWRVTFQSPDCPACHEEMAMRLDLRALPIWSLFPWLREQGR